MSPPFFAKYRTNTGRNPPRGRTRLRASMGRDASQSPCPSPSSASSPCLSDQFIPISHYISHSESLDIIDLENEPETNLPSNPNSSQKPIVELAERPETPEDVSAKSESPVESLESNSTKRFSPKQSPFYRRIRDFFPSSSDHLCDIPDSRPTPPPPESDCSESTIQIHRMLSIGNHGNWNPANPRNEYASLPSASHTPPNLELCMEFCWCFQCLIPWIRQWNRAQSNETGGGCFPSIYKVLWYILYTPVFNEMSTQKITRTQRCILAIRLCFELYKTMIGSYLTIFTTQKCGENVCTLLENVLPKDSLEIGALAMNTVMAVALLGEYGIEMTREKILRMYFESDPRLPVEKEYFTHLLRILDTQKATLLGEKSRMIRTVFRLYRRIGIALLSLYLANVCVSAVVVYKNYYDKSTFFGFVTNALFIVFKMASILKIAIHSISMPYSAYIETPVAFNSIKPKYIKPEVKDYFLFGRESTNSAIPYFQTHRAYMQTLLDGLIPDEPVDIENPPSLRKRNSFG